MWILCNENALVNEETASQKKKNSSAIVQFDATTQSNPIAQTGKYYIRPHYAKLPCIFFFFCAVPGAAVRNGTEFNIPGMQFLSWRVFLWQLCR